MKQNEWVRPVWYGALVSALLLVVYVVLLTMVSGWEFTLAQFSEFWYFVVALALGFGAQVALYTRLRRVAHHRDAAGKVLTVSGGTSTAAMVSCCTHYLANILPVLGATGFVALVAQFQTELFWIGLAFNAAGLVYVGRKLAQATRHMAQMEQAA